jgi:hypothetical protein
MIRGVPPKASVVAAKATVCTAAYYAIKAFWPGFTKSRLGRVTSARGARVAAVIDSAVIGTLRIAIPI